MRLAVEASQGKAGFSRSSLFRWGIAFWIVAWIGSVCFVQFYQVGVKGWGTLTIGTGNGSIGGILDIDPASFNQVSCLYRGSIFTDELMGQITEGPGWFGILATCEWRLLDSGSKFAIPIAGFLGGWLAIGLASELRNQRLARHGSAEGFPVTQPSSSRPTGLAALVLALACVTILSSMKSRTSSAKGECQMQIRNIQQAVRSWSGMNGLGTRQPINWSRIIGKGCFIENVESVTCPSGGAYELSTLTPDVGQLAAKCHHPEHQNFAHEDW